ncbi:MAG: ABC transporter ATP-binding protein [Chloroflexaceae bacterium]|nr:ABC transporter ATP-binding protein [Chloroflexaceae bacterium]
MSYKRLLLQYTRRYPLLMGASVALGFSSAIFNGVGTALIVPIVLELLGQSALKLGQWPAPLRRLFGFFEALPDHWRLPTMVALVLLLIFLKNASVYAKVILGGILQRAIANGLRLEAMTTLLETDLDFFAKHQIGDLINRVNGEINRTSASIRQSINLFSLLFTIFTFVVGLLFLSWQLTFLATFLLSLVALCNQFFIRRARRYGNLLTKMSREYSTKLLEILGGIRLIKSVAGETPEYEGIRDLILRREHLDYQSQVNRQLISPINEMLGITVVMSIVLVGRYLWSEQLQSVAPVLLTYLLLLFRLLPNISTLNSTRSQLANQMASVNYTIDLLRRDNKPFMVKHFDPYPGIEREICFEQVGFSYPGHRKQVLKDINLTIPKGKTVALVGASGAGKSTMADLLARFYDPTEGRITIDGKDLREFDLAQLRQAMGIVSQDTFLFNASVRYNIAYGMPESTEEMVVDAAKRANAYEFIERLPKGFKTPIGDRGVMLSGGQRQRLAIARALLRNPDILILDEATSALDTVSERLVQQAIEELCRDRTTLVIAHRLSTVQNAYQIVVMEAGKIVEIGNHDELLAIEGRYSQLYRMQFSKQEAGGNGHGPTDSQLGAFWEVQHRLSHEARTSLSALMGSLRLLAEDLSDNEEEEQELLEESYLSAMRLLNTVELFEQNAPASPLQRRI